MHCDGSYWTPDVSEVSYYTIQIYLTGTASTLKGGATRIWSKSERSRAGPKGYIDVDPRMGRILVFEQDGILHSGEKLVSGEKIAMRTEFMYGRPGDSPSELAEEEEAEDPDESEMYMYDGPITDVMSNDIICNGGPNPLTTPYPTTIIDIPAGATVGTEWHHQLQPNGYNPADSQDPIDSSHKGPIMIYLAKVDSALQSSVTGLKWFKIYEDGLEADHTTWAVDKLIANKGLVTFQIPPCIKPGNYFLRAEIIALHPASSYPGAQFYMECAQINITGGGNANPPTVSFPDNICASSTSREHLVEIQLSRANLLSKAIFKQQLQDELIFQGVELRKSTANAEAKVGLDLPFARLAQHAKH
ncbi:hypothetical protein FRB99_009032 [Tulasnella sp. 403]|nr:hypothetical protein FRB99_009032 [Tulasnella sp. 403]